MRTLGRIMLSIVIAVVVIPLLYLWLTGPVYFIACQGWREIAGYGSDVHYCMRLTR